MARKLWNLCVARTNALITDVHETAADQRKAFPALTQSDALAKKKEAAAAVTLLRAHCCNLLEACLCNNNPAAAGQVRVQDAHVGLAFMSKVRRRFTCIYIFRFRDTDTDA